MSKISPDLDLNNYKMPELKTILKDNNLKVSGSKTELVSRIKSNNIKNETIYESIAKTPHNTTKKLSTIKKETGTNTLTNLMDSIAEEETEQMLESIQETVKEKPVGNETCVPSTRQNTDFNFFELVFALCVLDKDSTLKSKEDIFKIKFGDVNDKLIGCDETCFDRYMKDGTKSAAKTSIVKNHINNMRDDFSDYVPGGFNNVKCVYLEGKNLTTQKLKKLNEGIDTKKAKADVYVETNDGIIVGFSLKQDDQCTMANYSTEKMLGELFDDKKTRKDIQEKLKQARLEILKTNGITKENYKAIRDEVDPLTKKKRKDNRINMLFYDSLEKTNAYWNALKHYIDENSERVSREIVDNLFPVDLKYNLYQFNGSEYMKMNVPTTIGAFNDHVRFYYDKPTKKDIREGITDDKRKSAAKMFYKLIVNGNHYRIEIRFKNPIITSAPQFQVHKDHQRTPTPESNKKISASGGGGTRKIRRL